MSNFIYIDSEENRTDIQKQACSEEKEQISKGSKKQSFSSSKSGTGKGMELWQTEMILIQEEKLDKNKYYLTKEER